MYPDLAGKRVAITGGASGIGLATASRFVQEDSRVALIDRDGAAERRKDSLKDVPSKSGYDRDEWPMAMCEEGGTGASVEYISPSDNRGAGSWVGNQVSDYPDGTKVLFKIN